MKIGSPHRGSFRQAQRTEGPEGVFPVYSLPPFFPSPSGRGSPPYRDVGLRVQPATLPLFLDPLGESFYPARSGKRGGESNRGKLMSAQHRNANVRDRCGNDPLSWGSAV